MSAIVQMSAAVDTPIVRPPPGGDERIDLQRMVDSGGDAMLRLGPDLVTRFASAAVERVFGYPAALAIGRSPIELVHADDRWIILDAHRRVIDGEAAQAIVTVRAFHSSGRMIWIENTARLIDARTGEQVIMLRDVTDRVGRDNELRAMALTDGLTGLVNRRGFDEALDREWRRAVTLGRQLSLLLLDVDHFKMFNDRHGHVAGDNCLRAVAAALVAGARSRDTVARYGGEELAVILPDCGAADALAAAERLREAIEDLDIAVITNDAAARVTASGGVATALGRPMPGFDMPGHMLQAADAALYRAKQLGRNRCEPTLILT